MRILLADSTSHYPSNPLFLEAIQDLASSGQYEVTLFDEAPFLRSLQDSIPQKVAYHMLRRRPLTFWSYNRLLFRTAAATRPDLVFIVKGALVSPATLSKIKKETGAMLINFATDDPFNREVSNSAIVDCIPLYDLYISPRRAAIPDIQKTGAKRVMYLPFGYKPQFHFPESAATSEEQDRFAADVVFIGGCDSDRVAYLQGLITELRHLRVHLYGGYWDRHPLFRSYHRGNALGRHYRLAVSQAKIAINLVRHANRDGHVMRSFELPACGGFMLCERTEEHARLFKENTEAAFFSSSSDLIEKVAHFANREAERTEIARAGHRKITSERHTYRDRFSQILEAL